MPTIPAGCFPKNPSTRVRRSLRRSTTVPSADALSTRHGVSAGSRPIAVTFDMERFRGVAATDHVGIRRHRQRGCSTFRRMNFRVSGGVLPPPALRDHGSRLGGRSLDRRASRVPRPPKHACGTHRGGAPSLIGVEHLRSEGGAGGIRVPRYETRPERERSSDPWRPFRSTSSRTDPRSRAAGYGRAPMENGKSRVRHHFTRRGPVEVGARFSLSETGVEPP